MGFRAIALILGCSNVAVLKWVRQAAEAVPPAELPEYVEIMELDEMWHFVQKKEQVLGVVCPLFPNIHGCWAVEMRRRRRHTINSFAHTKCYNRCMATVA
jgi:hypothetical protein